MSQVICIVFVWFLCCCCQPAVAINTVGGTPCVFPFTYQGKQYGGCMVKDHHSLWCGTTSNVDVDGKWGLCATNVTMTVSNEDRLYNYLMQGYNMNVRPSSTTSSPDSSVTVKIFMDVLKILSVDTTAQVVSVHALFAINWTDNRLAWDPALFGGLEMITLPYNQLWDPDLALLNSHTPLEMVAGKLAMVHNSGYVLAIPAYIVNAHCSFDLTNFPFDTQKCPLTFESWAYSSDKVKLVFPEGRPGFSVMQKETPEWKIISTTSNIRIQAYNYNFYELDFFVELKRKTTYFVYVFIGPAILLALLSPFQFLISSTDSNSKINLGVGIMIALTILLLLLETILPSGNSNIPVLGKYYVSVMTLTSLSIAVTIILSNVQQSNMPYPELLRKVLQVLGKVVCVDPSASYMASPTLKLDSIQREDGAEAETSPETTSSSVQSAMTVPDTNNSEWQTAAIIINRVLFVIFFVTTLFTFAILPIAR